MYTEAQSPQESLKCEEIKVCSLQEYYTDLNQIKQGTNGKVRRI
jgi:hypothetical protein